MDLVLKGVLVCIGNSYAGLIFCYENGVALWIPALTIVVKSIFYLLVAFYGTSFIIKHLEKWPRVIRFFRWFNRTWNHAFRKGRKTKKKINKETTGWLLKRKRWFVLSLGFVPYLPVISTAVVIAVRIMEIRRGLLILMIASVFKSLLICFTFYHLLTL